MGCPQSPSPLRKGLRLLMLFGALNYAGVVAGLVAQTSAADRTFALPAGTMDEKVRRLVELVAGNQNRLSAGSLA